LERGLQRIQLAGFGFIYLFFFMSLNKIFSTQGSRFKWIIFAAASYLCILLSLTRTYVAFSTVIALIYIFRNSKFYIKGLIAGGVIVAAFVIPNLEFVQNMVQMTKEDLGSSKDYIRVQAAQYFLNDFQPSVVTRILGNGIEYGENDYGIFIQRMGAVKGYFIGDLGLIGLYIYLGLLAIAAYVIIFYKGFIEKLSSGMNYLKMFIAFILLIGLNSFATYNTSFLLAIVFVVYLYEANRRDANEVPVTEEWDSQLTGDKQ
jgi:hypothetical protein